MKKLVFGILFVMCASCEDRNPDRATLLGSTDSTAAADTVLNTDSTHIPTDPVPSDTIFIVAHLTGYGVNYIGYERLDSTFGFSAYTTDSFFTHLRHPVELMKNADSSYAFKFHMNHSSRMELEETYKHMVPSVTADSVDFGVVLGGPGNLTRFTYHEYVFFYSQWDSAGNWISNTFGWGQGLFEENTQSQRIQDILHHRGKLDVLSLRNYFVTYDKQP